tara:strand:+ start:61 stop:1992 length:1932 start_codon:yes stop_codon:yes gene_type:complete
MKNKYIRKQISIKVIILLFLVIIPFLNSDYSDNVYPEKITSDLAFYEINTCSISLFEFLSNNLNVVYQDHYKIRFNDYSSIKCFGTITGIDQIGHVFYISIGTNVLINLFLQSFIWLTIISLISVNKKYRISIKDGVASLFSSLLLCFGIYSESRFYEKKFFEIDLSIFTSYRYFLIYFLFLNFFIFTIIQSRKDKIIQYLPFMFVFIGLYSGLNFYIYSLFFTTLGIRSIFTNKTYLKFLGILNPILLVWIYFSIGNNFYLDPDKIRGLSNTSFGATSIIFWSYSIYFIAIGIKEFTKKRLGDFKIHLLVNKFIYSSLIIMTLGYLGSGNPLINFLNYYFLGLNKYGTDNQSLFGFDKWNERIAWRGFFPSAETIGEYFALSLLISFVYYLNIKKLDLKIILLLIPLTGLLASNNKAAMVLLTACIFLKTIKTFNIYRSYKIIFFSFTFLMLIYFMGFGNLGYSIDFTSRNFINIGNDYAASNISSSLEYLNKIDNYSIFGVAILIIGQVSFLINRSELWGIFLARYNPDLINVIFGSGTYSLAKHYSEMSISRYKYATNIEMGFLLPHSSVLLILLFFGLLGVFSFFIFITARLNHFRKHDYDYYLFGLLLTVSLLKSDSILYMPFLVMYLSIIEKRSLSK